MSTNAPYYKLLAIAKGWALKTLPGWTDDAHRDLLARHGATAVDGRVSATTMAAVGLRAALDDYERRGWPRKQRPSASKGAAPRQVERPQVRKLKAMWWALADMGAVDRPADAAACSQAVEAWAKRQAAGSKVGRIDSLRFADSIQLNKLIEEMKAWGERVGADVQ